jgi:hypothetical protein
MLEMKNACDTPQALRDMGVGRWTLFTKDGASRFSLSCFPDFQMKTNCAA